MYVELLNQVGFAAGVGEFEERAKRLDDLYRQVSEETALTPEQRHDLELRLAMHAACLIRDREMLGV